MENNTTTIQEEFNKLAERDDIESLIVGSITKDLMYPQVGMTGEGMGILVIMASAVRQFALHVGDTYDHIFEILGKIISDVEDLEQEVDQAKVVQ